MMKTTWLALLVFALAGSLAAAEEDVAAGRSPEGLEILKKVDAAIKAVDAVRYSIRVNPTGSATTFATAAQGTSYMSGWGGGSPVRFYVTMKTTKQDSGDPIEVTAAGDGDTFFVVDHGEKKGYEDMDPGVLGSFGRLLRGFNMIEYVHDRPFDDELEAETIELQGVETVAGVECHKIHVAYTGGQGESTWYFSTEDFLPRRRVRHMVGDLGEGALEITVSQLEIDPDVDPSIFRMRLPEGYEQIDDFAP